MRVLVIWGSKRGGTAGIAKVIGDELAGRGHAVTMSEVAKAPAPDGFDAVIVGGALYANRWHRAAWRYANRYAKALRRVPVWLFSSGPLDAAADAGTIAPTRQVAALMERIGVYDHVTFGGRVAPDAAGFPARAMAKTHSGDWRNFDRVRAWANDIAGALVSAKPRPAVDPPARSILRLLAYAFEAAGLATAMLVALLFVAPPGVAIAVCAPITPIVFGIAASRYFLPRGAHEPLPAAICFAGIAVIPAVIVQRSHFVESVLGFWLPVALVFLVTWAIGAIRSTMPWPKPRKLREST